MLLSGSFHGKPSHGVVDGRTTIIVESVTAAEFAVRRRIVATSTTVSSATESERMNTRRLAAPLLSVVSTYVAIRLLLTSSNVKAYDVSAGSMVVPWCRSCKDTSQDGTGAFGFPLAVSPNTLKIINFQMLFDEKGNYFPTDNKKVLISKVEVLKEGKMFDVPVRLGD